MVRTHSDLPIQLPREAIAGFCRRWKIRKLELFGSALRPDFGAGSDLDFMYTFADDARWGWEFTRAWDELEQIVERPVDLVSRKAVEVSPNPYRRNEILSTARPVYGE